MKNVRTTAPPVAAIAVQKTQKSLSSTTSKQQNRQGYRCRQRKGRRENQWLPICLRLNLRAAISRYLGCRYYRSFDSERHLVWPKKLREMRMIFPVKSKKYGVDIMSINVLLENESDPVVWRGPVIGGTVCQLWSIPLWDNVDYLFVIYAPGNR